jgi:hypothetical protein
MPSTKNANATIVAKNLVIKVSDIRFLPQGAKQKRFAGK